MTLPDPALRDQLLEFQPLDPKRQRQLEDQVRNLVDKKITGLQWGYWGLFLVGGLWGAWFFWKSIHDLSLRPIPPHQGPGPELFMLGLWTCVVLCLFTAGLALYFMIRRRVDSRLQLRFGKFMPGLAWLLVCISFLYGCDDPVHKPEATWFGVYALAALVFTSTINLWNRIVAADQHAQEHLLRIEHRLTELSDRLPPPAK